MVWGRASLPMLFMSEPFFYLSQDSTLTGFVVGLMVTPDRPLCRFIGIVLFLLAQIEIPIPPFFDAAQDLPEDFTLLRRVVVFLERL